MRVDRWFAFVDLSGFTSFGDEFGDEESVRVLTLFRSAVRTVATDYGVRIAKWLGDLADSQNADGQLPVIVPSGGWGYGDLGPSPEWTTVYPFLVREMYRIYGDDRVAREHWPTVTRYLDWELDRVVDGLAVTALGDYLPPGYGGNPPEDTRLTATAGMSPTIAEGFDPLAPEHVSPFVVWLASERSGALTGRVFSVVGGYVGVSEGWRVGSSVRSDGPLDFEAIDAELPAAIDRAAPNFPVAKSHPYVGMGRS